jgi:hypothetical protein
VTQETDLLVTASGTPVGLLAVLVEELERAGSLSRDQFTRRLEASLRALTAQTNHDRRAGDKLEAEIIVELLNALARQGPCETSLSPPPPDSGRWNLIGVFNSDASRMRCESAWGRGADKRASPLIS